MSCKCGIITNYIEQLAPPDLAQSWDNCGLIVGDKEQEIKKVLVALDISSEVVDEAIKVGASLIVTHHPVIFKPINKITKDNQMGEILFKLISNNINVYSAHTNLDASSYGVNHVLARVLSLENVEVLNPFINQKLKKIVVFVPIDYADAVRDAMALAGAGHIGNYRDCSFSTKGIGTFKALEGANPFKGTLGELEKVEEYKLEAIIPESKVNSVINAVKKAHPYEEVVCDIYSLDNKGTGYGFARIGVLKEKFDLVSFAAIVKKNLNLKKVRFIGDINTQVKKVVVSSGAYSNIVENARKSGADVIVTGDLKYHDAKEILEYGMCAIDAGHFGTENIIIPVIADYLSQMEEDIEVIKSQSSKDIFMVL